MFSLCSRPVKERIQKCSGCSIGNSTLLSICISGGASLEERWADGRMLRIGGGLCLVGSYQAGI
jgi:hypothetical protein